MPDEPKKRVLITGAGGTIGTVLRRAWHDKYDLRLISRDPIVEAATVADISDLGAVRGAFDGVDVVVHLAASAAPESSWDDVLPDNIVGTYNVFEAARTAGVARVVFASSTHTVGMYYRDAAGRGFELPVEERLDEATEVRPDSLYGVSKVFGEALGRYFHEAHGLAVICLRIGFVRGDPDDTFGRVRELPPHLTELGRRAHAIWLSQRDCVQLFERAIDADTDWAVVYGTSDNPRQIWSLDGARRLLGFEPQDRAPD